MTPRRGSLNYRESAWQDLWDELPSEGNSSARRCDDSDRRRGWEVLQEVLHNRGEVRNSPKHQKGTEEAWRRGSPVARQRRNGAPVVGERGDRPGELLLTEGIPVDLHKRVGNGWSELSRAAVKKGKQGMVAGRFTGDSRRLQHRARLHELRRAEESSACL
jgi:hypothetical protein